MKKTDKDSHFQQTARGKNILKPKVWRWVKIAPIPMKPFQTICITVGLNLKGLLSGWRS